MTTEQRYYDRGASAAREDIDEGNACRVEDIDEGAVLAHLGLDDNGMETRAILADAAYRADDGEYADDGAELLEAARAAVLRGYREAMRAERDRRQDCHGSLDACEPDRHTTCELGRRYEMLALQRQWEESDRA